LIRAGLLLDLMNLFVKLSEQDSLVERFLDMLLFLVVSTGAVEFLFSAVMGSLTLLSSRHDCLGEALKKPHRFWWAFF
jgi:hypothetical protein